MFLYKNIETCSHVFLRRIAIAPPLTSPYDGPYKVVARSGRVFKIMMKSKVETVTAGRVKPAHIERKSENDSTQQNRVTPKSKPMASKPTAKTPEPRTALLRRSPPGPELQRSRVEHTVCDTDKGSGSSERPMIRHDCDTVT